MAGCKNTAIPNGVTCIGGSAFEYCTSLTSIEIPSSVTSIGNSAFYGCTGLTFIVIPESVTSIGDDVLSECTGLTSIIVEAGNPQYDSRNNCNAIIKTATNTLVSGCKNTIIPNSVTSIGNSAFYGCTGLTSVEIPSSVTSISYAAFYGCTGLTSITIPNSVKYIDWYAFADCTGLTSIEIPEGVTSIGDYAFIFCTGLTSITIPSSVTSIGSYAFEGCSGLTDMYCHATDIPTTGDDVFYGIPMSTATLHVPKASLTAYQTTRPWSEFGTIVTLENDERMTAWAYTAEEFADQGGQGNFPIGDAGTGDYTYSSVFFGPGDDPGLPISFRQNKLNPNKGEFKIEHWGYNVDLILRGEWDEANGFWRISVPLTFTGYVHSSYGNVYFGDWAAYYEYTDREPPTWEDLYAIDQAGTYDPNSGLFRLFVRYFVEAGSFGGDYETFQVDGFPDYTVTAQFVEIQRATAEDEKNQAIVEFTLGEDVATAKYAMTSSTVSEADATQAIISGELESEVIKESGRVYLPLEEDGKYSVTIVAFDAEGKPRKSASVKFVFDDGSWATLGNGSYTDDLMGGIFTNIPGPITYDVEVLASTKTPGLFCMKNPYGEAYPYNDSGDWDDSMDYYIEIDASDPNAVTFAAQELGLDWGYGMISAVAVETGKLEDGVITFPEKAFYMAMADYNGGAWSFYGNPNGAFRLELPEGWTRIENLTQDKGETAVYDLNGRRLARMQKGINIVRLSDGTIKKVIVK